LDLPQNGGGELGLCPLIQLCRNSLHGPLCLELLIQPGYGFVGEFRPVGLSAARGHGVFHVEIAPDTVPTSGDKALLSPLQLKGLLRLHLLVQLDLAHVILLHRGVKELEICLACTPRQTFDVV
jgi:hypothetical protein